MLPHERVGPAFANARRGGLRASSLADEAPVIPGWTVSWATQHESSLSLRFWSGRRAWFARAAGGDFAMRRRPPGDDGSQLLAALVVVHSGVLRLNGGRGTVMQIGAGRAGIVRMDRPTDVLAGPDVDASVALIPVAVLESRGIDTKRLDATVWDAGVLELSAVQLANSGWEADPRACASIESAVCELVVGSLAERDSADEDDASARARARATAVIDERYADPDLDADVIARSLGVSRRYLYSLFEGRELSVAALIRHRRVAHAQSLLVGDLDLPLRQIAQLSGLGSEDRLLRTFKTVLHMSPSAYRRAEAARDAKSKTA